MSIESLKSAEYKKNRELEELLDMLNTYLDKLQEDTIHTPEDHTHYPIVFIVGVPRSGTTLMSQWLAATEQFCYPTNFISRFYKAPHFGALIQELLFNEKYNYKDELSLSAPDISFRSDVGKTKGMLEPHEFWYFWRRFFDFPDTPVSIESFEKTANFAHFISEVNMFQEVFKRPFFLKSLIINPYILSFAKHVKNSIFLYIRRDPIANMQSLLTTRKKYFNDEKIWFSFKPIEYQKIMELEPPHQVAGQVFYLNKMIEDQLAELPQKNKVLVDYDKFCNNPAIVYHSLKDVLGQHKCSVKNDYSGVKKFEIKDSSLQPDVSKRLSEAYQRVKVL